MRFLIAFLFSVIAISGNTQLLTWSPDFIQENSTPVIITMDGTKGNEGLKDYLPTDVYVHIGVITTLSTSSSDWKYSKFTWATTPVEAKAAPAGTNKWTYTITGGLRAYFGIVNPAEKILKIAMLFRNGSGSRAQRNADGSDLYIPVYEAGLNVRLIDPPSEPKYTPTPETITKTIGQTINLTGKSSTNADLKLYYNGVQLGATVINGTSVSATASITSPGLQTMIAEAKTATETKYDTIKFFVNPTVSVVALPAGVKDGINYDANNTSVTLVLYAPNKTRVSVIGDFNNWTETVAHQMNRTPDGLRYWLTLNGLTSAVEYGYQYLIDNTVKVADYMTEKVLDPSNDQFIPAANYPDLKPYPAGKTTGIVSIFQTAKPTYNWQVTNFAKPDKRNLVIYELLVRDFVGTQRWSTVKDSIAYLKRLGVTAIEVMPFNEFEGNNSWGYNSDFYFAPDKIYGTETALRQFIDECHKQGIAVIMDIVLNHTYGPAPMALMYWDAVNNRPAANNPWYNPVAPHTAISFGTDFNHESAATKEFFNRVLQHWIINYKVDGYRFDFTKGLTQKATNTDAALSAYDASRIAILNGYANSVKVADPNAYMILEHFTDNSEEKELADNGMMLWASVWTQYQEAALGYIGNSNFGGGVYTSKSWTNPHLVTFMESHDEERITYKNLSYGNSAAGYNIKDSATALKRMGLNAAFLFTIPGPKMIWEFGELGYDYSRCYLSTNGEGGDCNRKTDSKPVRWDYQLNANRQALYSVYSKLLTLRKVPDYLPTFVTNNIQYDFSGNFKKLQVTSNALKLTVIGNFDVVPVTGSVTFANAGTWYNYLQGGTKTATGAAESITLQPGEYYVYLDRDPTTALNALPLKLLSFGARRTSQSILLDWVTANEINVKHFELERSMNGIDFKPVGLIAATNSQTRSTTSYQYSDKDALALNASAKIFYRLKMVDKDGATSYSSVAAISPVTKNSAIKIYPNPVTGSKIFVSIDKTPTSPIVIKIADITGRQFRQYTLSPGNYSNGNLTVDVSKLATGAYILKVETGKSSSVQQFIINH